MYTFAQPLSRALSTAAGSCAIACQDSRRTYPELGKRIAGFKVPRCTEPPPKSAAGKILRRGLREPHWAGQHTQVSGG